MQCKRRSAKGVEILDLSGKITIGEGDVELRKTVQAMIDAGHRSILLDLDRVGFMDSAALGEMVACFKRATEKGGTMKLLRPSGKVADLLSLTKITEIFEIYEDEGEALASFRRE